MNPREKNAFLIFIFLTSIILSFYYSKISTAERFCERIIDGKKVITNVCGRGEPLKSENEQIHNKKEKSTTDTIKDSDKVKMERENEEFINRLKAYSNCVQACLSRQNFIRNNIPPSKSLQPSTSMHLYDRDLCDRECSHLR